MRQIPLTRSKYALVDDEDYEHLSQFKWCVSSGDYPVRSIYLGGGLKHHSYRTILMHREILGLFFGDLRKIDHKDHNPLNNQRANLRICTQSQNRANSFGRKDRKSEFKGVHWREHKKRWRALIGCKGKRFYLGSFASELDAAYAYDRAAIKYFGEFAKTNF